MRYFLTPISALLCCVLLAVNRAPAKPGAEDSAARSMMIPGHVQINKSAAPEAGIKLLEVIFQRVRNQPQLAMAKQGLKYKQAEQLAAAQQHSNTDYRLAIRPQEQAMQPAFKRKSNVVAYGQLPPTTLRSLVQPQGSFNQTYGDESQSVASNAPGVWEAPSSSNISRQSANSGSDALPATVPADAGALTNAQGIWERERAKAESAVNKLSPESRERITNSVGKLFGLTQALEEAQNSVDKRPLQQKADEENKPAKAVLAKKSQYTIASATKALPKGGFVPPPAYQIMDERPVVRDLREAGEQAASSYSAGVGIAGAGGGSASRNETNTRGSLLRSPVSMQSNRVAAQGFPAPSHAAAPSAAPASAGRRPLAIHRGMSDNFALDADQLKGQVGGKESKDRLAEVALLPPNVVSGIPLVHLGYSEAQATQALGTLGNAERHTGNGWTVLSFRKPGTADSALQVYMRHGSVEALRIFDASLVGPDFGVNLGDDLQKVKVRFGEPNFILQEPYSGHGQNYVYAISQVAFQLSRPARGASPQVVSVLIFNVK